MTHTELLNELKALGTEQNRKIYKRHGAKGDLFGVSFANLNKLKKKIKVNHELAKSLWASGNYDAQIFATFIADPKAIDRALLEEWVKNIDNYPLADAFAKLVGQSALAQQTADLWTKSKEEWIGRAGWQILAHLAMNEKKLPDSYFESYLQTIETQIHHAKNFAKSGMNLALIAIGIRNEVLTEKALAVAKKIGKIEIDHGETECKTPDAAEYIHKTLARKQKKA